jgi:hypothetical protein
MDDKKKRVFVKPELIKFDKPLDVVTLGCCGSPPCDPGDLRPIPPAPV